MITTTWACASAVYRRTGTGRPPETAGRLGPLDARPVVPQIFVNFFEIETHVGRGRSSSLSAIGRPERHPRLVAMRQRLEIVENVRTCGWLQGLL